MSKPVLAVYCICNMQFISHYKYTHLLSSAAASSHVQNRIALYHDHLNRTKYKGEHITKRDKGQVRDKSLVVPTCVSPICKKRETFYTVEFPLSSHLSSTLRNNSILFFFKPPHDVSTSVPRVVNTVPGWRVVEQLNCM